MYIGESILWILVIVLSVIVIVMVIIYLMRHLEAIDVSIADVRETCQTSSTAPDIGSLPCCRIEGNLTSFRYVPSIDMVVSPSPRPYISVCEGFCTVGIGTDGQCHGGIGQDEYDQCVALSQPNGCIGTVRPVARIGTQSYYPFAATQASCLDTDPC